MIEDEMVRWHQQLDEHEFEQALGDGEGQKIAAWGLKESDTTEQLNKCHLGSPFLKISVYFCLYLNCFVYMKAKTRMERGI